MVDARVEKLADVLVNYSLEIKEGDKVLIRGMSPLARPLMREVVKKVVHLGAHPMPEIMLEEMKAYVLQHGNKDQAEFIPLGNVGNMEGADCRLAIRAPERKKALKKDVQNDRIHSKALRELRDRSTKRWCLVNYPTRVLAEQAGMWFGEYQDFLYGATLIDWNKLAEDQQRIVDRLTGSKLIHIVGNETDIRLNVMDRKWINCCGKRNMPDGEVYTSPQEYYVNGHIYFDLPSLKDNELVQGVRLHFEEGEVVEGYAEVGNEIMQRRLKTDEFSRFVGELAFGFNYGITRVTGSTLFDEKIGGTMHMALGNAYKNTGGIITSAIHWDLIRNLNPGIVKVDGSKVYEDGKWLI